MTESKRVEMLELPRGPVSVIIDTDPHLETDDHYALAYAICAAELGEMKIEGLHADFSGKEVEEGMLKNYDCVINIIDLLNVPKYKEITFHGPTRKFDKENPEVTDAVKNMIRVANNHTSEDPVYVLGIGGGTTIASALAAAPEIAEKMVIVWLGGNSMHWHSSMECNFWRDSSATEFIFDCGVPLVMIPAWNVTIQLKTSSYELDHYMKNRVPEKDAICEFLLNRFNRGFDPTKVAKGSGTIYDIGGIGYVLHPEWYVTRLMVTPVFQYHWASNPQRHMMRICDHINRDALYMDVFNKLTK
ncbi:MAG: nucleoside hydrolase [Clostridia bacterium]|nr:nucleoside hydrolase [Clostridia bacterium]